MAFKLVKVMIDSKCLFSRLLATVAAVYRNSSEECAVVLRPASCV